VLFQRVLPRDNGAGLGASHQPAGGLVADLILRARASACRPRSAMRRLAARARTLYSASPQCAARSRIVAARVARPTEASAATRWGRARDGDSLYHGLSRSPFAGPANRNARAARARVVLASATRASARPSTMGGGSPRSVRARICSSRSTGLLVCRAGAADRPIVLERSWRVARRPRRASPARARRPARPARADARCARGAFVHVERFRAGERRFRIVAGGCVFEDSFRRRRRLAAGALVPAASARAKRGARPPRRRGRLGGRDLLRGPRAGGSHI